jgi:creatinine amidohydrolase
MAELHPQLPESQSYPFDHNSEPSGTNASTARAAVLQVAELSFSHLKSLDRSKTVVIFAASPLEEHGTHLPVGTDLFEAEFFSKHLAGRIADEKPGWTVLLGPSLPFGASAFNEAGTLLARARTVRNAVLDYGAALARNGFRTILVTNAHAGPRHVVALEEAAAAVSSRYNVRMLSVSGPVLWKFLRGKFDLRVESLLGRPLTDEETEAMRGDAHAGLWETSLLLHIRPELVNPSHATLAPQRFSLWQAARYNYPLRLGNCRGYIGSPAPASKELGEVAAALLLDAAWEVARKVFDGRDRSWWQTSFLYKILLLRTGLPYGAVAAALLIAIFLAWHFR